MSEPLRASLASRLLADGIPPSLLIDLLDPEGMKLALASELLASDIDLAPAPPVERRLRSVQTA
ncbi:MAG: hypothetical protein JWM40_2548 [Frankiales bacterium]|nr:hypothetical protein [Frankiales bacterium]